jgi:colanic acid biosynthesis glycosyl transferase WcaI
MRFLFLNQYFPPDPAPTGIHMRELGDFLADAGHEVSYIASGQEYRSGQGKGNRLLFELRALGSIFWKGLFARRPDVVVSATSPPMLYVVASLIALRHRANSAHWVLDMYPELAVVLGELPPGPAALLAAALGNFAYRRMNLIVALDQDMVERIACHHVKAVVARHWLFASMLPRSDESKAHPGAKWTWTYSGNLGRAHEWKTLLDAQALIEKRGLPIRLLFQGGGPARAEAQRYAAELNLQQCEWRGYVDEDKLRSSLLEFHVLVASQKPEVKGLLWPSKVALLTSLPRPVLWVGPTDGAIARDLAKLDRTGFFSPGDAAGVAKWVESQFDQNVCLDRARRIDAAAIRQSSLQQWKGLLEALSC